MNHFGADSKIWWDCIGHLYPLDRTVRNGINEDFSRRVEFQSELHYHLCAGNSCTSVFVWSSLPILREALLNPLCEHWACSQCLQYVLEAPYLPACAWRLCGWLSQHIFLGYCQTVAQSTASQWGDFFSLNTQYILEEIESGEWAGPGPKTQMCAGPDPGHGQGLNVRRGPGPIHLIWFL